MNNLLFSLADVGANIVNGLTSVLGELWYIVLINLIGVIAICFKLLETQNKKRSKIVLFAIFGAACWITYFVLNGNFNSAAMNLIGCTELIIFSQRGKYKWADSIFWLVFFLAVKLGAGIITWNGPLSLFAIIGSLIGVVAYFIMNEKLYRYLFLAMVLLWIANGIVYFYPIAVIHDSVAAVSIIIAIVRYNILGKDKKQSNVKEQTGKKEKLSV